METKSKLALTDLASDFHSFNPKIQSFQNISSLRIAYVKPIWLHIILRLIKTANIKQPQLRYKIYSLHKYQDL